MESFDNRLRKAHKDLRSTPESELDYLSQTCSRKIIFNALDGKATSDEDYLICKEVTDAYRNFVINRSPELETQIIKEMNKADK